MSLKARLKDAHENFPIIDSHPAVLFSDALNRIIELEGKLKFLVSNDSINDSSIDNEVRSLLSKDYIT